MEKIAMVIAIAGLGMVMMVMIGQEYDSQMINIAWVIIAVKMADLAMVLFYKQFEEFNYERQDGKENSERKERNNDRK